MTEQTSTVGFGDRVRTARKFAGFTQKELADHVKLSQTAIHKLEIGRSVSSRRTIAIAIACDVNPIWLETGRGEMSYGKGHGGTGASGGAGYQVPIVAGIPLISWEEVKAYTAETAGTHHPEKVKSWIPVAPLTSVASYALEVSDDSMKPEFCEGEIVIVDPTMKPEHNRFIVARADSESWATLKQLIVHGEKQYMKPLNSRYPLIEVQGGLIVAGVVVAKYKGY